MQRGAGYFGGGLYRRDVAKLLAGVKRLKQYCTCFILSLVKLLPSFCVVFQAIFPSNSCLVQRSTKGAGDELPMMFSPFLVYEEEAGDRIGCTSWPLSV